MKEDGLEEKIVFFEKFAGFLDKTKTKAKKRLGVYLTATVLAFGAGLSGCGGAGTGTGLEGCTHTVGGQAGYAEAGCPSGEYCKCDERTRISGSTYVSCSCVSESPFDGYDDHW